MVTVLRINMAVVLVHITILAFLASGTLAGYMYPKPTVPFDLPINKPISHNTAEEFLSQSHENAVSYSIPIEEYHYLKQHKVEHHDRQLSQSATLDESKNHNHNNEENLTLLEKIIRHYDNGFTNLEETAIEHNENQLNGNSASEEIAIQQTSSPNIVSINETPIIDELPNVNIKPVLLQNEFPNTETIYGQPGVQNIVEPVIHKHIYFHVPPPDIEEPVVQRVPEPIKKTYKIIFIKVPSQEASNNARIQQAIYNQVNQNSNVGEKTLIYVLVKKPEPVEILPPPPSTPSEHEVLFVNYKGKQNSVPLPVVSDLFQESSELSQTAKLPGFVNSQ